MILPNSLGKDCVEAVNSMFAHSAKPLNGSFLPRVPWFAGSTAAHAIVLALLIWQAPAIRVRALLPGNLNGKRIDLLYLPGGRSGVAKGHGGPSGPLHSVASPTHHTPLIHPGPSVPPPQLAGMHDETPAAGSSPTDAANDALGTNNIQIALTTYSPSPKPDLSHLPPGTQGEVVLDVTIDPNGKVADLQILRTLGYGVDGLVVETVRTWTFRPATKDGVPVASIQELHFHYGPV